MQCKLAFQHQPTCPCVPYAWSPSCSSLQTTWSGETATNQVENERYFDNTENQTILLQQPLRRGLYILPDLFRSFPTSTSLSPKSLDKCAAHCRPFISPLVTLLRQHAPTALPNNTVQSKHVITSSQMSYTVDWHHNRTATSDDGRRTADDGRRTTDDGRRTTDDKLGKTHFTPHSSLLIS